MQHHITWESHHLNGFSGLTETPVDKRYFFNGMSFTSFSELRGQKYVPSYIELEIPSLKKKVFDAIQNIFYIMGK